MMKSAIAALIASAVSVSAVSISAVSIDTCDNEWIFGFKSCNN